MSTLKTWVRSPDSPSQGAHQQRGGRRPFLRSLPRAVDAARKLSKESMELFTKCSYLTTPKRSANHAPSNAWHGPVLFTAAFFKLKPLLQREQAGLGNKVTLIAMLGSFDPKSNTKWFSSHLSAEKADEAEVGEFQSTQSRTRRCQSRRGERRKPFTHEVTMLLLQVVRQHRKVLVKFARKAKDVKQVQQSTNTSLSLRDSRKVFFQNRGVHNRLLFVPCTQIRCTNDAFCSLRIRGPQAASETRPEAKEEKQIEHWKHVRQNHLHCSERGTGSETRSHTLDVWLDAEAIC